MHTSETVIGEQQPAQYALTFQRLEGTQKPPGRRYGEEQYEPQAVGANRLHLRGTAGFSYLLWAAIT